MTIGGFGTIAAVLLVAVYLLLVSAELFTGGDLKHVRDIADKQEDPVVFSADEYLTAVWTVNEDAELVVSRYDTGDVLVEQKLFEEKPTAWSVPRQDKWMVAGFADGSIKVGQVKAEVIFLSEEASKPFANLGIGDRVNHDGGVVECTGHGQYRWLKLKAAFEDAEQILDGKAVHAIAHVTSDDPGRRYITVCAADGTGVVVQSKYRESTEVWRTKKAEIDLSAGVGKAPDYLYMTGLGDNLLSLRADGSLRRYEIRSLKSISLIETANLLDGSPAGTSITSLTQLPGRSTLVVGDSSGTAGAWFRAKTPGAETADQELMTLGHRIRLEGAQGPVTAIGASLRSRLFAMGYADGHVVMMNMTTQKIVDTGKIAAGTAIDRILIAPKENALMALSGGTASQWSADPAHHDASMAAIVSPVHYEGYPERQFMWQSTGGTDGAEPKLSLIPLIFGTLKGTVVSLLFAIPIALCAAVYTSEFMHKKVKATVKPCIEMMASLPSVVLGFLGAGFFAVLTENNLIAVILSFFMVPFLILLGAHLWQLLPRSITLRYGWLRVFLVIACIFIGPLITKAIGPAVEQALFTVTTVDSEGKQTVVSDMAAWLNALTLGEGIQVQSSPVGGWFLFLVPVVTLAVLLISSSVVKPRLQMLSTQWEEKKTAVASLIIFLVQTAVVLLGALVLAHIFGAFNDLRGSFIGNYVQRNALVVGFVMGFAVIPIIYTIAEDALTAVPVSLRLASLGAGATPWQTAQRIVIPTAMSGLFSAMMVGLGRCVGETMIVLMAAGNTPLLEMNIFNGFRTLSANIAVELPEAVQHSTHYRLLFLSGLVLFAMTFVLNTIAEAVRLRFRKRAVAL